MLQKYRLNVNMSTYIDEQENMNKNDLVNKENSENSETNETNETNEIINKLYSNDNITEKHNSKTEYSGMTKLKGDGESEKYIKEMHELADKNELRNNAVVLGLGIIIASVVIFSIFMNTSFMKPKTDVATSKVVTKTDAATSKVVTKNAVEKPSTKTNAIKPVVTQNKIYTYLNVDANRTSALKKAVALNGGSKNGVTVYLLSEILRANAYAVPKSTSSVKQLMTDLTSMGWKKNTNVSQLKKGDICFTIDMPEKPGSPSHAYVFMSWVKEGKTDYANVCDGQLEDVDSILHKRNISVATTTKDQFGFFLRK